MLHCYIALLLATAFGNALSEDSNGHCRAGEMSDACDAVADDETTLLQTQQKLQPSGNDETHRSQFAYKKPPKKITDERSLGLIGVSRKQKRFSNNQKRLKEKFQAGNVTITGLGDWLDGVSNDLTGSFGPVGGLYHDCLSMTDIVLGVDADVWGGSFETYTSNIQLFADHATSQTLPDGVDVSFLQSDLLLYGKLLGSILDSTERFCTVVVEYVWPVESEPDCMRFLTEVSLEHAIAAPTESSHWPEVVATSSFGTSFLEVCQIHNTEAGNHVKVRDIACDDALAAVQAAHLELHPNETHAHLLAQVCIEIGMPLSSASFSSLSMLKQLSISKRSKMKLFAKAAELTPLHPKSRTGRSTISSDKRVPQENSGFVSEMITLSTKQSGGRARCDCDHITYWPDSSTSHEWCHRADGDSRAWCTLQDHLQTSGEHEGSWWAYCDNVCPNVPNTNIADDILGGTCCDSRAYAVEVGMEAAMGLTLATGMCFAWGWDKPHSWSEQDDPGSCPAKMGIFTTRSVSFGLDLDVTGYVTFSYFHSYPDVSGYSKVMSAGLNFFGLGIGGAHIRNGDDATIGWYASIEYSAGDDSAMVSIESSHAEAWATAGWESGTNTVDCRRRRRRSGCFPSSAWVETRHGPKQMHSLQVGDQVLSIDESGKPIFDDVYFFGHAAPNETSDYLTIHAGGQNLEISEEHFVPTCPHTEQCLWTHRVHKYAKALKSGDWVWLANSDSSKPEKIVNITLKAALGLYNPYTLSGTIVVNGVVGSAHSKWILDPLTPDSLMMHVPAIYQTLFLPGRWLYHIAGPSAANFLDVNNPSGSEGGLGPQFLMIVIIMLFAATCCGGFAFRSTMENMSKKNNVGIHMKTEA